MSINPMDAARQQLANLIQNLQGALLTLQSPAAEPEPGSPRAVAIGSLQAAIREAQNLADTLGDVPAPVRH